MSITDSPADSNSSLGVERNRVVPFLLGVGL